MRETRPRVAARGTVYPLLAVILLGLVACAPTVMPAGPAQEEAAIDGGTLRAFDGAALPVHAWLPPEGEAVRAVVLALHGFNDYGNFFAAAGAYLAGRGIASYAYDQRGFGASPHRGFWPGTETLTKDAEAAVSALRQRYPDQPLYVLGESMGGAVAILMLSERDGPSAPGRDDIATDIDGVVLSAPAVWDRGSMPWYQTTGLWLAAHTVPWLALSGRGVGIVPSDNVDMLRALARDPLVLKESRMDAVWGLVNLMDQALAAADRFHQPALILYGERDELVPKAPVQKFFADLPAAADRPLRVAIYEEGYHMLLRDLQAETVWRDIAAWISEPDTPLPSGAEIRATAAGTCRTWNLCDKVAPAPAAAERTQERS